MPGTETRSHSPRTRALPQLTIQQLDYLVAIADSPTWAIAAKKLGVSASALSQGIAELERRLGLRLFERTGRRRVLAPESAPVLGYARTVIAQSHDLGRWIQEQASGGTGQLRLGMIDAAALHYYSETLRRFRIEFPDVDLRLSVGPSGPLLEQVQRNQLDLAIIVRPQVQPTDLDFTPLADDPLAVYSPRASANPQASIATNTAGPASGWGPWVGFPETSHTRSQIAHHLSEHGSDYRVVAESNQPEVLCEMVRLGLGWTVLPVIQAEAGPHPLSRAINKPLFSRQLIAIRRSNALPHPIASELLAKLSASGPISGSHMLAP